MLSKSVTLRLFYDMIINRPFVANQYDNSTTRAGISIRFSLAQKLLPGMWNHFKLIRMVAIF
ncbi:MAG: hypothetical protein RBS55_13615, partial [Bacteroidales bacterium]|nr:hypothetical protein [Bacteroidales bacterium]